MFIWLLTRLSSTHVYYWRALLWVTEINNRFIIFTKITIFLQLWCKKACKLMIITSRKKQHSNSTKFNESCLKKIRARCEVNVTMLFRNFYEISWIRNLIIESMKINKVVFTLISNRATRKCLSHSFIITKFAKQL